jgi:DNA invertase Pin-like site-specific DNA recombinase
MGNEYYPDEYDLFFDMDKVEKLAFDSERNVKRDSKGRLNKGSRLAQKDNCNEYSIKAYLGLGYSVKRIVAMLHCSKSTVYRVKKQYDEQQAKQRNEYSGFL